MKFNTQVIIKAWLSRFSFKGVLTTTMLVLLVWGCSSSKNENPAPVATQTASGGAVETAGVDLSGDDPDPGNGSTFENEEFFTCENPFIPIAITDIGPLVPMILSGRAYARDRDAWYQKMYTGQPVPINHFVLAISADWMRTQNNAESLLPLTTQIQTRSSCLSGSYLEATQRLSLLDITSNVTFSAELLAGNSMADYARVRTSIYSLNVLPSATSGIGEFRSSNSFPVETYAKKLPTVASLFSDTQAEELPDAPLQVVISLELPKEWVVSLDQEVEFTLTYGLEDGTTFTAISEPVDLKPYQPLTKLQQASWRMSRYTRADGSVVLNSDFYLEEGVVNGQGATVDDAYQSLYFDFDSLTDSGAVDKLNVNMPSGFCAMRVLVSDRSVSISDSLIEPGSRCNTSGLPSQLISDIVQTWLAVDTWSYQIENEVLKVQFGESGVAEFTAWR